MASVEELRATYAANYQIDYEAILDAGSCTTRPICWAEDPVDCEVCSQRGRDHEPRRAVHAVRLKGKHGVYEHRIACEPCTDHLKRCWSDHLVFEIRWFREYITDLPTRVHTRAMMRWADQAIAELEARVNSS